GFYIATNPSGCLTLSLYANSSLNYPGFAVNISRPESRDLSVINILPGSSIVPGPQNVQVVVQNLGFDNITNFTVEWAINGVAQTPVPVNTTLPFYNISGPITLG